MELFKVMAVAATGLGLAWTASQLTDAPAGGGGAAPAPAAAGAPAAQPEGAPAGGQVQELSEAEMAAEIERIQREAGTSDGELKEFKPSKPLPADLAIALPSDI